MKKQINVHTQSADRKKINKIITFNFIFSFVKSAKKIFLIIFLFSLVISAASLGNVFVLQELIKVIGSAFGSNLNTYYVNLYSVSLLALYFFNFAINYLLGIGIAYVVEKGSKELTIYLYAKLMRTRIACFDQVKLGDILSRLRNDLGNAVSNLPSTISQIATSFFTLFAMLLGMFLLSSYLSLIALILLPISFLGAIIIGKRTQKIYGFRQKALGNLNAFIEEAISGQKEISLYNQEKHFQKLFSNLNKRYVYQAYRADFWFSFMIPWSTFSSNLTIVVLISVGAIFMLHKIPMGGIYDTNLNSLIEFSKMNPKLPVQLYIIEYMIIINSFLMMLRNFNGPLYQIMNTMNVIQSFFSSSSRLMEMRFNPEEFLASETVNMQIISKKNSQQNVPALKASLEPKFAEQYQKNIQTNKIFLKPFYYSYLEKRLVRTNIVVKNLSFEYLPQKPVLKNINFEIKQGQTVAIVGPTGSGKSTFINLLTKFYDITDGDILFDGLSIKHVTKQSIRNNVSLVLQDNIIFNDTIFNNIKYGNLNASHEEIIDAAKKAQAHNFIMQLENGYETMIKNNGDSLSHGQKQLIGISRAILSPSELLILDEATSSVDTTTEKQIQAAMLKLMKSKTSLVIAHRLSTIKNADLILVLKEGQIIEQGNHDQLLKLNGFYAQMYHAQTDQNFGED